MNRFDQILSPASWLVVYLGFLPLFFVIFQPTWWEFGVFFVVDYLALVVMRRIDARLFLVFHPDSAGFFPDDCAEPAGLSDPQNGLKLFGAMVRFPRRRALYCLLATFPKAIPGALVIVFYWHHSGTIGQQALKLLALVSFVWSYFYVAVYIESHRLISEKIALFHQRYDWKKVFEQADYPFTHWDFKIQEGISLASISGFALLLHWLVGRERALASEGWTHLPPSLITFAAIALIARIWYLEKLYFVGGIESLFRGMEATDPAGAGRTIALRSTTLLAQFGRTFNAREERLGAYQRELAALVQYQVEESRYQAIGELSALTVHEMSAPLHVIQFLTRQIEESPDRVKDPEYRRQLSENVAKTVSLLQSLRTHLSDSVSTKPEATFGVAYEHALQLLAAFFQGKGWQKIDWTIDPRLSAIGLRITNADLIHILFSLLKLNLQERAQGARVTIALSALTEESACITLTSNGAALSPERFEELTALIVTGNRPLREALEMRLTRGVVERNGGRLRVVPAAEGTSFELLLPVSTP